MLVGVSTSSIKRYLLASAGLLLVLGFASLSSWQFGRAGQKQAWLDQVEAARGAAPQALAAAVAAPESAAVPVAVRGEIELRTNPRLLLDNQQREGRVGLREYALVRAVGGDERWFLADLGWLPIAADRRLPTLDALPARLEAQGLLTELPGQGLRLAPNPVATGPVALLNYLDVDELSQQTGLRLLPRLLRLDPALSIGHARDLDVLPNTLPPDKHRGYALQWAGLALAALVTTLLLFFRSRA